MAALHFHLFGRFQVLAGDSPLHACEGRKAQELLCYLLLNRDRPHTRESLACLLWENRPSVQARKYLRHTLWQLQTFLDEGLPATSRRRVLVLEEDWVSLNADADLWVDVERFEQAHRLCQGNDGKDLAPLQTTALAEAAQLYQGDLLEGWYQDWCLFERERLQSMFLEMLDKLVDCCVARQDYVAGLRYAEQILRYDGARERTHRRLMRLYYLTGDRTAALRQYERCVAALAEELDVRPSRSTNLLAEQIRRDRLDDGPGASAVAQPVGEPTAVILRDVLQRLKLMQSLLGAAHQQVHRDIQSIERLIGQTWQPR